MISRDESFAARKEFSRKRKTTSSLFRISISLFESGLKTSYVVLVCGKF